jgi:hypothetical protein
MMKKFRSMDLISDSNAILVRGLVVIMQVLSWYAHDVSWQLNRVIGTIILHGGLSAAGRSKLFKAGLAERLMRDPGKLVAMK